MTLGALELDRFAHVSIPVANSLAVCALDPVSINRAMALCTEQLDMVIPDGFAAPKSELLAIFMIMAAQAQIVGAVAEHDIGVLG